MIDGLERSGTKKRSDQGARLGGFLSASYVSQLLGGKYMGDDVARKISEALGHDRGWMDRPQWGEDDQPVPVSLSATTGDYVRVEQLDGEAAMGVVGRSNDDYPEVIRAMDFAPAYIRSVVGFVPPPGRLKLVTGVGDSMAPKIRPGESVLVDTGCNEFVGDGLYLINTGYGQQIKALQAAPDGLWARSSDQTLYPPFRLTEDTVIGGRVYLIQHLERVA
ncbi:S24 family peptidase [Stenotrophomonas sp.]|uniref:S24 family peptidase n=1 Tax=Stenotrophomonas sp. TaxID=69392 RepID=UPI0028AF12AC|nr:S24 family peptidase [Stenotrophomonas sp.]